MLRCGRKEKRCLNGIFYGVYLARWFFVPEEEGFPDFPGGVAVLKSAWGCSSHPKVYGVKNRSYVFRE